MEILSDLHFLWYAITMTLTIDKQESLIRNAMALAAKTAQHGNRPFAGILADEDGNIVLQAVNTVHSTNNAAAHAEINLLFLAGEKLGTSDLSNYIFISNAASCPMCMTALIKAKITRFYYGATNEASMVPHITMDQVIQAVPFPIEVHGGILADECKERIDALTMR